MLIGTVTYEHSESVDLMIDYCRVNAQFPITADIARSCCLAGTAACVVRLAANNLPGRSRARGRPTPGPQVGGSAEPAAGGATG